MCRVKQSLCQLFTFLVILAVFVKGRGVISWSRNPLHTRSEYKKKTIWEYNENTNGKDEKHNTETAMITQYKDRNRVVQGISIIVTLYEDKSIIMYPPSQYDHSPLNILQISAHQEPQAILEQYFEFEEQNTWKVNFSELLPSYELRTVLLCWFCFWDIFHFSSIRYIWSAWM